MPLTDRRTHTPLGGLNIFKGERREESAASRGWVPRRLHRKRESIVLGSPVPNGKSPSHPVLSAHLTSLPAYLPTLRPTSPASYSRMPTYPPAHSRTYPPTYPPTYLLTMQRGGTQVFG